MAVLRYAPSPRCRRSSWRGTTCPRPSARPCLRGLRGAAASLLRRQDGVGVAQEGLDVAHRVADAVLVLDQRQADIALAMLAEADAGGDRDLGRRQQQLGE